MLHAKLQDANLSPERLRALSRDLTKVGRKLVKTEFEPVFSQRSRMVAFCRAIEMVMRARSAGAEFPSAIFLKIPRKVRFESRHP